MIRTARVLVFVAVIFTGLAAHAAAPTNPRVGVLDLASENLDSATLSILSDRLRAELTLTGKFIVLERQQINAILDEQGFQLSPCSATECAVEVGQLVGAKKMIAGSIGRVGAIYTLIIRSIDVETGAIERTAMNDCRCEVETLLTTSIRRVAFELAGVPIPRAIHPRNTTPAVRPAPVAPAKTRAAVVPAPAAARITVYMTRTGERYHRDGCRHLSRSRIPVSLEDAKARGLTPCRVCRPPE